MALPFLAQAGIALAPTGVKYLNEAINPSEPSEFEQKLAEYAEIFGDRASQPVTENSYYKSGKRELDAADQKNREQTANVVGAGNVTNEVKLASMDDNNQNYTAALNRIIQGAQRWKQYSQGQYLNTLSAGERAKQQRLQRRQFDTTSMVEGLSKGASAFLQADALGNKNDLTAGGASDEKVLGQSMGKASGNFFWGN